MIFRSIMLFGAVCLILLSGCEKGDPGIKTSEPTAEQIEVIREYVKLKAIGMDGKLGQFIQLRDSITMQIIAEYFARSDRSIDAKQVKSWATNWPEVAGLPIVQDSTLDRWRRIVFKRPTVFGDNTVEKAIYPILFFGLNDGEWRVSNATKVRSNMYNPDSTLRTIDQFTYHDLFRLPPDFTTLLPQDPNIVIDTTAPRGRPVSEEKMRRADSIRNAQGR